MNRETKDGAFKTTVTQKIFLFIFVLFMLASSYFIEQEAPYSIVLFALAASCFTLVLEKDSSIIAIMVFQIVILIFCFLGGLLAFQSLLTEKAVSVFVKLYLLELQAVFAVIPMFLSKSKKVLIPYVLSVFGVDAIILFSVAQFT